jgi:hypothetical protein
MIQILMMLCLLMPSVVKAEDQAEYVLRHDYWGRDLYWEFDDSKYEKEIDHSFFYVPDTANDKPVGGLLYSVPDFKWMEQNPKHYGDKGIVIVPALIGGVHLGTLYYYEYKQKCDDNTLNIISGDGCWELRHTLEIKDYEN